MELAIITAKQVVILYCLILAGFAGVNEKPNPPAMLGRME